ACGVHGYSDGPNARAVCGETRKGVRFGKNSLGHSEPGQTDQRCSHAPRAVPHTPPLKQTDTETAARRAALRGGIEGRAAESGRSSGRAVDQDVEGGRGTFKGAALRWFEV